VPHPDVRERFQTVINAPADMVLDVASGFDLQSLAGVRAIFWLRERLMRVPRSARRERRGLLADMRGLGWGLLLEQPGRLVAYGAVCQPWLASPRFSSLPPDHFAEYAEPNQVKIAWTLEAAPLAPAVSRFAHEIRVAATDAQARNRFRRYWRWARFGIVGIRWLLLPAIRRAAERRWAAGV
jgi:hypothetical protein